MTYTEKLRHPKWQKKRLQVLEKDDWKCRICRSGEKFLQVHHKAYRPVDPWDYQADELEALCLDCHHSAHDFLRGSGRFSLSQFYTSQAIKEKIGADDLGFLPVVNGHVVCGRFRKKFNPDAPEIILPGDLDSIREPMELFCRQSFPIPVFLDIEESGWRYEGDFRVESWTENPTEIAIHKKRAKGNPFVSRVIFLKGVPER